MSLEQRVVFPENVSVTFVHAKENADFCNAMQQYDRQMLSNAPSKPIIVVDIDDRLYVYDGNKHVRHARDNDYGLNAIIIYDETDFKEFLETGECCWFGVTDFEKLKSLMKMYSEYPDEMGKMPEEYVKVIAPLVEARNARYEQQQIAQLREFFPYDDDD